MQDIPFAYSSNGDGFQEHDLLTGLERTLSMDEFPTVEELTARWESESNGGEGISADEKKVIGQPYYSSQNTYDPRYYQRNAINRTVEAIAKGQERLLLVMATGTGKTYTAFQIVYRLLKSGLKRKVLYLADRNILVDQSIQQDFSPLEKTIHKINFAKDDPVTITSHEVYFSLYQQLAGNEENEDEGTGEETVARFAKLFNKDFFDLIIVDESHITIPQIRGMYNGDQARKTSLVDYGFRLPSAKDNRPLNFTEFEGKIDQMMFVSATPSDYEAEHELERVEQIIRPTGLLDPEVVVKPTEGQIDDLISEIRKETSNHNKVLVTTLTKRMAEDLTSYMKEVGIRVKYLHSDIDTLERAQIIRDMRLDVFDVLVGINLLREGLDIPEISLVAILDADKEGFLRSETSLIQTIGRAARNADGHVIMYADVITDSMDNAIKETNRRRKIQQDYNEANNITPQTIKKAVRDTISISKQIAEEELRFEKDPESMSRREIEKLILTVEKQMRKAAAELDFESAAEYRDKLKELRKNLESLES